MSTAVKYKTLAEVLEYYPELPWKANAANETFVLDEKKGEYVKVEDGAYVVSIGSRFEVQDKKPEKAKAAKKAEKNTATGIQPDTTVDPQYIGTEPGTEAAAEDK